MNGLNSTKLLCATFTPNTGMHMHMHTVQHFRCKTLHMHMGEFEAANIGATFANVGPTFANVREPNVATFTNIRKSRNN